MVQICVHSVLVIVKEFHSFQMPANFSNLIDFDRSRIISLKEEGLRVVDKGSIICYVYNALSALLLDSRVFGGQP